MNQEQRDELLRETHTTVGILSDRSKSQGEQITAIFERTEEMGKQVERNSTMVKVICAIGSAITGSVSAVFAWMFLK